MALLFSLGDLGRENKLVPASPGDRDELRDSREMQTLVTASDEICAIALWNEFPCARIFTLC